MNTKILRAYAFFVSLAVAISLAIMVILIGSAGTDKNVFERDIRNFYIKLAAANDEAERLRQENERKAGEVEDLKKALAAANDEAERLRQENERKAGEVEDLKKALAAANDEAERLRQENERKAGKLSGTVQPKVRCPEGC